MASRPPTSFTGKSKMRTILRQLLVLACFIGGWSALLYGLSWCGLDVKKAADLMAHLIERKASDDLPVGPGQVKSAEIATRASENPLIPKNLRLLVPPRFYAVPGQYLRLLIVGDSLTHSTFHINELTRSLSRPGNPKWELLGTNTAPQALPGVRHEGYGGWTWHCFLTWNEKGSAKRRYRD